MKEYRVKIEHIEDGIHTGTDYFSLTKEEYIRVMRIVIDSDEADEWEDIYQAQLNNSNNN